MSNFSSVIEQRLVSLKSRPPVVFEDGGEKSRTLLSSLVFDGLNSSVDMRSRARFERFFALNQRHSQYCEEQVRSLRARSGS